MNHFVQCIHSKIIIIIIIMNTKSSVVDLNVALNVNASYNVHFKY